MFEDESYWSSRDAARSATLVATSRLSVKATRDITNKEVFEGQPVNRNQIDDDKDSLSPVIFDSLRFEVGSLLSSGSRDPGRGQVSNRGRKRDPCESFRVIVLSDASRVGHDVFLIPVSRAT